MRRLWLLALTLILLVSAVVVATRDDTVRSARGIPSPSAVSPTTAPDMTGDPGVSPPSASAPRVSTPPASSHPVPSVPAPSLPEGRVGPGPDSSPSTAPVTPPATVPSAIQSAGCSAEVLKLIASDYEVGRRTAASSHDAAVRDLEDEFSGSGTDDAEYQRALAGLEAERQSLLARLEDNRKLAEARCEPDLVLNGS